jgi:hypothetical protein
MPMMSCDEILYSEMPCLGDKRLISENGKYAVKARLRKTAALFSQSVFTQKNGGHRPEEHCVHHFVDLDYAARVLGKAWEGRRAVLALKPSSQ